MRETSKRFCLSGFLNSVVQSISIQSCRRQKTRQASSIRRYNGNCETREETSSSMQYIRTDDAFYPFLTMRSLPIDPFRDPFPLKTARMPSFYRRGIEKVKRNRVAPSAESLGKENGRMRSETWFNSFWQRRCLTPPLTASPRLLLFPPWIRTLRTWADARFIFAIRNIFHSI